MNDLIEDSDLLNNVLRRHAELLEVFGDIRPAASAWSLDYLAALLPAVIAGASVLKHRFDVDARKIAVTLNETWTPACFHLTSSGTSMRNSSTAERYQPLLRQHLEPLFTAISKQTRLSKKVLWSNAARCFGAVFDQLLLAGVAVDLRAEQCQLLQQPHSSDGEINPLYSPERKELCLEQGTWALRQLHRHCCLHYLLPGRSSCSACPGLVQRRHVEAVRSPDPTDRGTAMK